MTSRRLMSTSLPMVARLRRPPPPSHAASPVAANAAGTAATSASDINGVQLTPSSGAPHMPRLRASGRVAERFKAAVLKTARGASPSWVRIPPLPPKQKLSVRPRLRDPPQTPAASFDHLVGAQEKLSRDFDAKRLGGLQVEHELEVGRRLDRQLARLCASEDAVDI